MSHHNKNLPPLNSLVIFNAVANCGSFTSAAKSLFITTTAISKQIKLLEDYLNTELFIRQKQGVVLTNAGKEYAKSINKILLNIENETKKISKKNTKKILRIMIGNCFSSFWLIPHLNDFREKNPDINISLVINDHAEIAKKQDYDICFYYGSVNENEHTKAIKLFEENIIIVCNEDYLKKSGGINFDNIWNQTIIAMQNNPEQWKSWMSWAEYYKIKYNEPEEILFIPNQVSIIQAAINGAGVALAWDWHVTDIIKQGILIEIFPKITFHDSAFYLIESSYSDKQLNDIFINWIKNKILV